MKIKTHPLPHFNERKKPVSALVLHCSAFHEEDAYKIYDEAGVSTNYFIDEDGTLTQMVAEDKRAWHAGVASWREITEDFNSASIGIEICNMSLGETPYTQAQIKTLIPLCREIIKKYHIQPQNVVAHSDIAPMRKMDPGMTFPWQELAQNGIGLWYDVKNADKIKENDVGKLLKQIGYKADDKEETIAAAYAFRRRFLPEEVEIVNNVRELIEHPYPQGKVGLLQGEKFLQTLKAAAYSFEHANEKILKQSLLKQAQNSGRNN